MTMTSRSPVTLRPLRRTTADTVSPRDPGGRRRRECWFAETADGEWGFERLEISGTPWQVYWHPGQPDQQLCSGYFGNLTRARQAVELGHITPPQPQGAPACQPE